MLEFDWVPLEARSVSRRKVAAHALFHSQRHWAQLATLVRQAGFPSGFRGDLLFSWGCNKAQLARLSRSNRPALGTDQLSLLLEAGSAQHRPALRGLEGNRGLRAALRAGGARLRADLLVAADALRLALLAALGVVLELFVVEENLLARRKDKLGAAVNALQIYDQ